MNRGLIEGILESARASSPAVLPRFMNRGLIEGRTGHARQLRAVGHFPDS